MGAIDRIKKSEYLIINLIFTVLISLIFIYSLLFAERGAYPVKSSCIDINNPICISKGLSRAFSQIIWCNFEKAKKLNPHSLLIFLFLFTQIIFRVVLSFLYVVFEKILIIRIDKFISLFLFIFCFKSFFLTLVGTIF